MEWIQDIFINSTFIQAIIVLSIICAIGLALGQIKIGGVSLGVTFVFFTGILAGHFGFRINPDMLLFAQNFGLVLFIYSLGVQVGPGFFSSFKQGGVKLNLLATSVLVLGTAMALGLIPLTGIPLPDMMGLLSGAVTNTPMLGAGQQTLLQIQPDNISGSNNMALACAVGYPMGVIGVILALVVLKTIFSRKITTGRKDESTENAFVSEFLVSNPAIFGLSIKEVMKLTSAKFVISRDWKKGKVNIPTSETIIEEGDHLLVISNKNDVDTIRTIFGEKADKDWNKKDIDWNRIDRQLVSRHILVTKPNINGVKLVSLKLRNTFGINITRVNRAGIDLLASPSLRLQLGDKLTIVGETTAIDHVAEILGNEEKQLNNPNLFAIFLGLATGLILGSIPLSIPGMSMPVKLGLAGGPLIVAILISRFGPHYKLITYTTMSANLMLREIGISLFLACVGLNAGEGFVDTVVNGGGWSWIGYGFVITFLPLMIIGIIARVVYKINYFTIMGLIAGSTTDPPALAYSNATAGNDMPSVSYATVYPLTMFLRVLTAQVLVLSFA